MKRFIEGEERGQGTLLPEHLDDYVTENNPVRVVDVFVEELDLASMGFTRVAPAKTGRPAYHPAVLLKLNRHEFSKHSRAAGNTAFHTRPVTSHC